MLPILLSLSLTIGQTGQIESPPNLPVLNVSPTKPTTRPIAPLPNVPAVEAWPAPATPTAKAMFGPPVPIEEKKANGNGNGNGKGNGNGDGNGDKKDKKKEPYPSAIFGASGLCPYLRQPDGPQGKDFCSSFIRAYVKKIRPTDDDEDETPPPERASRRNRGRRPPSPAMSGRGIRSSAFRRAPIRGR